MTVYYNVTRRGVLSILILMYDSQILQLMCKNCTHWDSPLPGNLQALWKIGDQI